ncbi:GNAT family N-acetyltransferase [Bacillus pseudomycoides]|uniref:GNAT family N-acetyltransferase n=1 Tax=Bacillus bingmayongensis TaxID=1150157 RepID=A0ABU5K1T6_9BACI|nr:GNAT family N-acetyltransferase [Bacillus pseudomycoides]
MIKKLTKGDHKQVLAFLNKEAAINLFIIGDIEAFGYEADSQELWGVFTENGALQSVLLRFHDSFIPYGKDDFSATDYEEILATYKPLKISGKAEVVEKFEDIPNIQLGIKNKTYFCECKDGTALPETMLHTTIKLATIEDVARIINLRNSIEEFPQSEQSEKILQQSLEMNTGRTYYIEEDGEIVASASTSAENSLSAMVIGVCTHLNYRGKGYASLILQKMIQDFTQEGKTLCLFYNNPAAGRIYKRLGFQDIGMWTMYR